MAYEEAREALLNGALPARVLPTFGEDFRAWSPGEVRSAALLSGFLWGTLKLDPQEMGDALILDRLLEVQEEVGLGEWVQALPRVLASARGTGRLPVKEAALRVMRGEVIPKGGDDYLLEVARHVWKGEKLRTLRERVKRLLLRNPKAKVGPQDLQVILGRIRAGKEVWIRASEEEYEAVLDKVVSQLSKGEKGYISPDWAWQGEGPHPRILLALERIREATLQEELEPPLEEAYASPHSSPLREEDEVLVPLLLGHLPEDPRRLRALLEDLLALTEEVVEEERPVEDLPLLFPQTEREKALVEELLWAEEDEEGNRRPHPDALKGYLERMLKRLVPKGARFRGEVLAVRRFLRAFRPLRQERYRALMKRKDLRALKALALEAAVGALEVLLAHGMWEEGLSLAYELGVEAVREMRSPHHHPAGYAARKARERIPYYRELGRNGVALDPYTAEGLFRLRRAWEKDPGADLDRLARRAKVPREWAEEALPLLLPQSHLEDPVPGTEGLELGDAVEGGEDPATVCERKALQEAVAKALASLEPHLRQVVELADLEGLPLADVGHQLGLPLEEVEARLALAHNQLRYALWDWAEVA